MEKTELTALVRSVVAEEMAPHFKDLERRLDRLTEKVEKDHELCDGLIKATVEIGKNNSDFIKLIQEMTESMRASNENFQKTLDSYRDELHSAKGQYNKVSDAYIRLSESNARSKGQSSSTKSDIVINNG